MREEPFHRQPGDLCGEANALQVSGDAAGILLRAVAERCRQMRGEHEPDRHCLAVQQALAVAGLSLQRVRKGMAKVQ